MTGRANPGRDPLAGHERLEYREDLPVLGVMTSFESNDPRPIERVRETFGAWRALQRLPELLSTATVSVRIVVHEDDPRDAGHVPVRYHVARHRRLLVATPGSRGAGDRDRGEATLRVTPTLLNDVAHFNQAVLSALTLFLVTAHDRRPVHAAAVADESTALLLHGPSGVGKSTLALACSHLGMNVIAEDAVYAQVSPSFRVWGLPGPLHLTPEAFDYFPRTSPGTAPVRVGTKRKLAVDVSEPAGRPLPTRARAAICLLRQSTGPPRVEPADAAAVEVAVGNPLEPGFDAFRGEMGETVAHLIGTGAWVLHVGHDPHSAAEVVGRLLAELSV